MNSKTSFFSKTIIKCDLKRYWWASVLSALLLFLSVVIPTMDIVNNFAFGYNGRPYEWRVERITNEFVNLTYFGIVLGMGTALVLSAMLFGYLNKVNAVSCIHGLPIKRKTLYFSHLLSGIILLAVPVLLTVPFLLTCVNDGLALVEIFKFVYVYMFYSLCFLSFGTFIGMLTGNSASHVIFTIIAALLPLFAFAYVSYVCESKFYGFSSGFVFEDILTKYVYLFPEQLLSPRALIYVVAIIAFVFFGLVLYKKRNLENHGEIIAFPSLKGTFKVLVGICAGMLGFFYTLAMWNVDSLLSMIPFAIIGLVIAHMLAQKSFSLKGIVPCLVITVCTILAFTCVIHFDLTGFESRVPDVSEIESVRFKNDYVDETFYARDQNNYSTQYVIIDVYRPVYDDPEEIQYFVDAHKYKVENRESSEVSYPYSLGRSFDIEYTLKNGHKMYRRYYLTTDEVIKLMSPIYETDTFLKYAYPILDETEKNIVSVGINDVRDPTGKAYVKFSGTTKEAQKLVEAIKKDRANMTFEKYTQKQRRNDNTTIVVEYTKQGIDRYGHNFANYTLNESYTVSDYDVNTLRVLDELGFYENENLVTADDVSYAVVTLHSVYTGERYVDIDVQVMESVSTVSEDYFIKYDEKYYDGNVSRKTYSDREQIEQLFTFAIENTPEIPINNIDPCINVSVEFAVDTGEGLSVMEKGFWSPIDALPSMLKEELKNITK